MEQYRVGVVIVAGGSGSRMGSTLPKQFALVGGEPILARTINTFAAAFTGAKIVVVLPASQIDFWKNYSARFRIARHTITEGGQTRFHSVKCGIESLSDCVDLIAIHDGVRPFASKALLHRTADCAAQNGAAIPVIEVVDSFRVITQEGNQIADRTKLRIVQTPQIFDSSLIRAAYDTQYQESFTDDASVVEQMTSHRISLCAGERTNIKITTPDDMIYAHAIAEALKEQSN